MLLYTANMLQEDRCTVNTDAELEYVLAMIAKSINTEVSHAAYLPAYMWTWNFYIRKNDYITDRAFPLSMSTYDVALFEGDFPIQSIGRCAERNHGIALRPISPAGRVFRLRCKMGEKGKG